MALYILYLRIQYTVLKQLTQPASLASFNSGTDMVLYGRGQLGSILSEDALATCLLPSCYIIFIYAQYTGSSKVHKTVDTRVTSSNSIYLKGNQFHSTVNIKIQIESS